MGQQQCNGQTRIIGDKAACRSGSEKAVLDEHALVSGAELHHQFFLFIVRQECDIHNVHSFNCISLQ
jgi:hypothetical protein